MGHTWLQIDLEWLSWVWTSSNWFNLFKKILHVIMIDCFPCFYFYFTFFEESREGGGEPLFSGNVSQKKKLNNSSMWLCILTICAFRTNHLKNVYGLLKEPYVLPRSSLLWQSASPKVCFLICYGDRFVKMKDRFEVGFGGWNGKVVYT